MTRFETLVRKNQTLWLLMEAALHRPESISVSLGDVDVDSRIVVDERELAISFDVYDIGEPIEGPVWVWVDGELVFIHSIDPVEGSVTVTLHLTPEPLSSWSS